MYNHGNFLMKHLSPMIWFFAMCMKLCLAATPSPNVPSGAAYDWTKTKLPERPYFHKYDQSLVMKIFLAERINAGKDCKVYLILTNPGNSRPNGKCSPRPNSSASPVMEPIPGTQEP